MNLPNRIFFTGVPGSKWSGIAQVIEDNVPGMNISDRSPERQYIHEDFTGHVGAYFGDKMEFPADVKAADFAHKSLDGCRLIKSHDWSYIIDEIKFRRPNDWIMMVYRNDYDSFNWWKKAGGFEITYPNYESYIDDRHMKSEIRNQNKSMVDSGIKYNCIWSPFDAEFMKSNFGVSPDLDYKKWDGIHVTIIK